LFNFLLTSVKFFITTGEVDGGWVSYSSYDNGYYSRLHHTLNTKFIPPHDSFYMIFGSYAQHAVSRVSKGTRISLVFFYQPQIRFHLLIFKWGMKTEQCPMCFSLFESRETLRQHFIRGCCEGKVSFNRFKEKKYQFNPDKEL
jgi:hypothetical protein